MNGRNFGLCVVTISDRRKAWEGQKVCERPNEKFNMLHEQLKFFPGFRSFCLQRSAECNQVWQNIIKLAGVWLSSDDRTLLSFPRKEKKWESQERENKVKKVFALRYKQYRHIEAKQKKNEKIINAINNGTVVYCIYVIPWLNCREIQLHSSRSFCAADPLELSTKLCIGK